MAEVPGPCRHSVTREHLLTLRHLSKCCFVKAALPWILELLSTHFKYSRGSVNDGYVQSLRALVLNIYSQKCVPQIDEQVEDKPESFELVYRGSTLEALQMASEALSVYRELVTTNDAPVDWRCQDEYAETFGSTSAELYTESPTPHFTEGFGRSSAKASQRRPVRDAYLLGLILVSVCGGLLLVLTLYCLVTQKATVVLYALGEGRLNAVPADPAHAPPFRTFPLWCGPTGRRRSQSRSDVTASRRSSHRRPSFILWVFRLSGPETSNEPHAAAIAPQAPRRRRCRCPCRCCCLPV
ncbi:hypothetical protein EYF80_041036 [Liparis tanakae]|uniref:Uncharacterized protein n=1 Tax=Liparis tanakae TaxID=230148 RepID=A0A4Z2G804_9TELE|nr:hypothetical protein EYF80_041036 [Liparis tanakae]